MQESVLVHELDSLQKLYSQHQNRFQRKLAPTVLEQVLETGPQEVYDHDVVVALSTEVVDLWQSDYLHQQLLLTCSVEYLIQLCLVVKLRELRLCWL